MSMKKRKSTRKRSSMRKSKVEEEDILRMNRSKEEEDVEQ